MDSDNLYAKVEGEVVVISCLHCNQLHGIPYYSASKKADLKDTYCGECGEALFSLSELYPVLT